MPTDPSFILTAAAAGGIAAVLAAGVRLAAGAATAARFAAAAAFGVAAVGAGVVFESGTATLAAAAVGGFLLLPAWALGSAWVRDGVARPGVRWGGSLLAAAGVIAASVAWYDRKMDDQTEAEMAALSALDTTPELRTIARTARTDRGTPVELRRPVRLRSAFENHAADERFLTQNPMPRRAVYRGPADDHANCHGWVFTDGRYWILGRQVPEILAGNGYHPVSDPKPGDLAVYREGGVVTHTAVVRYTTAGRPPMVEGKWGAQGVYLHAADDTNYGADVTYYHSDRGGHRLAGLGDATPETLIGAE